MKGVKSMSKEDKDGGIYKEIIVSNERCKGVEEGKILKDICVPLVEPQKYYKRGNMVILSVNIRKDKQIKTKRLLLGQIVSNPLKKGYFRCFNVRVEKVYSQFKQGKGHSSVTIKPFNTMFNRIYDIYKGDKGGKDDKV